MSLSTTIYVGYYIEAKMKQVPSTEMILKCSKNQKHEHHYGDKFCPKCGAPIIEVPNSEPAYRSFQGIECDDEDLRETISEPDFKWLEQTFSSIPNESIGQPDENWEILLLNSANYNFDADNEYIYETEPAVLPKDIDTILARLKYLMLYDDVQLKHGVIVQVA